MVEKEINLYNNTINLRLILGSERNVRENENTDATVSTPGDSLRSFGGSASSLNSASSGNKEAPDTPHHLQVLKHQKEVWENGILL